MDKIPVEVNLVLSDYIKNLSKEIKVKSAILFGSYAKENWKSESDIDIAIFSDDYINYKDNPFVNEIVTTGIKII